jgi:NADP-dependent 3-hydroxy acid dehydrogenase YdfG
MSKPLTLITGASSGIGEAAARVFSEVDVTDRGAIGAALTEAEARFGPVDCVINNAGVAHLANILEQEPREWDDMIAVNITGVMNILHAVMQPMAERRRGTIINMSSIAGRKIYPDHTVYCGTKYFVHAVSESIRAKLAPYDVRVMVISPGIVETEVLDHVTDPNTLRSYRENKVRIGGGISAAHVAQSMLFAYELPQNVLIQEICITPTRQEF